MFALSALLTKLTKLLVRLRMFSGCRFKFLAEGEVGSSAFLLSRSKACDTCQDLSRVFRWSVAYLGTELIESIVRVLKLISKLSDPSQ